MRVLVIAFVFCHGTADAAPDCAESPRAQPSDLVAFDASVDLSDSANVEWAAEPETLGSKVATSPRPQLRPCRFRKIELGRELMRNRGAVCNDWTIIGDIRKPISGNLRGCGIAAPVRVRKVSDVFLSQLALMDCETAITLKTWIENTAKPAFADHGGGLKGIRLAGHYSCRTQNNRPRARLSEHARGRAIDISSFILMDGTVITVGNGWKADETSVVMRDLHKGACGLFGTVLGPDADRFHVGHFHFDTARRRGGSICR